VANAAISVDSVWKNFRMYHERNQFIKAAILRGRRARYEEFWALKDVSFEVPTGSTIGIIGSNGSGKSTMLKCLAGILYPNKGAIHVNGKLAALLELGAGFHPELSGRENIYLNSAILGMSRQDIASRYDSVVEFSGLGRFIDTPVKNYSSGMVIRLGFSIACHVEPEILLIDEILSVGDQSFQRRSGEKIEQFRQEGRTIVIVSHGLGSLQQLCEDLVWLEKGEVRRIGPAADVIAEYTGDSYAGVTTVDTEQGERWGTGEGIITSVELIGPDGQSTSKVESGQAARIRVNATTHLPLSNISFKVMINHLNGSPIWSSSTARHGFEVVNKGGSFFVQLDIKQLPLLEGRYSLSVAMTNRKEVRELNHWRDCLHFDVHQENMLSEGTIDLECSWSDQAS
jgi:ABC-2 type transport system ATP-binding protein